MTSPYSFLLNLPLLCVRLKVNLCDVPGAICFAPKACGAKLGAMAKSSDPDDVATANKIVKNMIVLRIMNFDKSLEKNSMSLAVKNCNL